MSNMIRCKSFWITLFIISLACSGQKPPPQIAHAKELLDQNNLAQAQKVLEEAQLTFPRQAEVAYLLGWTYFQSGRSSDALAKFGAAIKYDSDFFGGYNGMGSLLMIQGNSGEALEYFKKAAERNPKSPEILANMAELNLNMGKADDAEELLTKAKTLSPQSGDYDFLLAQHHYRRGNLEKSKNFLDKSADLPFKKTVLFSQIPCLRAGIETKSFEGETAGLNIKSIAKNQRSRLEKLQKTFAECEHKDRRHFDFANEKSKVETWLKPKKS